jgi:hypothetical protein
MGMSKSKQYRRKTERAGLNNPEISRNQWHRKPHTQIVQNKKAEQRRTQCRHKGSRDGAHFFKPFRINKFHLYPFLNGHDTNVYPRPKDGEAVLLVAG